MNPLSTVEAFQRFQENIGERCDEPPVVVQLEEVGSFRFHERARWPARARATTRGS